MTLAFVYGQMPVKALSGEIKLLADDIYVALVASTYAPDIDTHDYWDDVVANEVTGTGYTAAGQLLGTKTLAYTADTAVTAWAASTAYKLGAIRRPTTANGFVYRASIAGSSAATQPTWPTVIGQTVVDGGVTWTCVGRGVIRFKAANPSWASSTITARYAVFYDRTPATNATRPLIAYIDFEADKSSNNGAFTITVDDEGIVQIPV